MPNDLAMFRVTGRSYSVGESDPDVMSAASEVIPSVEHDGFARKIADLAAAGWVIDDAGPQVGADGEIRTPGQPLTRRLLYP